MKYSKVVTTHLFLTVLFGFLLYCVLGYGQTPAKANTIDVINGRYSGKPIGVVIMNSQCYYGTRYHYQVTAQGELRLEGGTVCGSSENGTGGQHICYLNSELHCTGKLGDEAAIFYAVGQDGVSVGSTEKHPWAKQQSAVALFPLIEQRAEKKCEKVLHWEAIDQEQGKTSVSPEKAQERADCWPVLDRLCAQANGGPVKLDSGKDISNLCRE
jgi:hypothetical protein